MRQKLEAAAHAIDEVFTRDAVAGNQVGVAVYVHWVVQGSVESLDRLLGYASAAQHRKRLCLGQQMTLVVHDPRPTSLRSVSEQLQHNGRKLVDVAQAVVDSHLLLLPPMPQPAPPSA